MAHARLLKTFMWELERVERDEGRNPMKWITYSLHGTHEHTRAQRDRERGGRKRETHAAKYTYGTTATETTRSLTLNWLIARATPDANLLPGAGEAKPLSRSSFEMQICGS